MNALLNYRSRVVKVLIALTGCISLVFVSQGCARIHPVTLNATVSAAHIRIFRSTVTPSSTSVSSSIPAKTPLPQTKIPTATHTFTLTPTTSIIEIVIPTCSGGGHPLPPPKGFGFEYTLVYQGRDLEGLYTTGGSPLVYSRLPVSVSQKNVVFGFSPDGKWLAYSPIAEQKRYQEIFEYPLFVLLSSTGKTIEFTLDVTGFTGEIPEATLLIGFGGGHWINDRLIYVRILDAPALPIGSQHVYDFFEILDPFQRSWREDILTEMPYFSHWSYEQGMKASFSPDMKRVLYVYDTGPIKGKFILLWDLTEKKAIFSDRELPITFGAIFNWAPDSSVAVYTNYNDPREKDRRVFLIDRDGVHRQPITSFTYPLNDFQFQTFAWSRDSRYLAMVGTPARDEIQEKTMLFIYDRETNQYMMQCPMVGFDQIRQVENIYWSPDNRYIAFRHWNSPLDILDLETGQVIRLAEEALAVGWSDKFPVEWP